MTGPTDAAREALPIQLGRTRRFTLGVPRSFVLGRDDDGDRVLFLRSDAGDDPVNHLWIHDVATGASRRLVDARTLDVDLDDLSDEERLRRERARDLSGGITTFSTDRHARVVALAVGGRVFTVDVATGARTEQPTHAPAFDPRVAPDGRALAWHAAGDLVVVDLAGGAGAVGTVRGRVSEEGVAWGRAEFIAAEEMGRSRGFWWSPDASRLAVCRVDERDVDTWTIADPSDPTAPARTVRYPAAGRPNARVGLALVDAHDLARTDVALDALDEYVAVVRYDREPLTVLLQGRDQRRARIVTVDPMSGSVDEVRRLEDAAWIELVPGAPTWSAGRLVTVEDDPRPDGTGTRRLRVDGRDATPDGLQVRELVAVDDDGALVTASTDDPTSVVVAHVDLRVDPPVTTVLSGPTPGVHRVVAGSGSPQGPVVHMVSDTATTALEVRVGRTPSDPTGTPLAVVAETPVVTPRPQWLTLGVRGLRAALLMPEWAGADDRLPVLLDPYGGPHAQRVLSASSAFVTSQWFADQGLAVLVVDGRGTPGRGPEWERAVHRDLAGPALDDQVDALAAALALDGRLDGTRVAIRGWSFGGTLAALAVLRRPDVFRAAIAGAPVTDWRLYDTHYTERYLGRPDEDPEAYRLSGLVDVDGALTDAADWGDDPPSLMLVHGLADDNVVAAHALRLSRALLLDGRPHRFLPLPGVTHVAGGADVTARLLGIELAFLEEVLIARR